VTQKRCVYDQMYLALHIKNRPTALANPAITIGGGGLPALVIEPRTREAPEEYSHGTKPT
jgi:hypothetical protein